jgi:hypothetical protein
MTTNLPAYLANRQSRGLAQSLSANLGQGSPPFLSIMGNRFTLIDSTGEEIPIATYDPKIGPYIDCVIIDSLAVTSKTYYDKPFDPAASQYEPPACFSDNGIGPSRNSRRPQSPTCASCPQAAWGSKISAVSHKGIKACSDVQKVAMLYPGYEMPFLVRIPPNSRTNFRGYVNKFVGQAIDLCDVLTRITFEPGGVGTLHFDAVGYVDEATFGQTEKLLMAKATDSMIGRLDRPIQGQIAAPQAPTQQVEQQVQQSGPFVAPPAATPSMPMAPSFPASQGQPATPASPSNGRRRRNTAQAAPQAEPPTQAPFMQPAPQQPAQPAPAFGMAQGAAPGASLQNTLEGLFGKK